MSEPSVEQQSAVDSLATIASGGALVAGSKFISLGFGFLTQLAMARLLTEGAYGEVVLTLAVVNIAGLIAKLGLDDGVTRELPHYEDDPSKARGVVRAGLGIGAVSGVIAGAIIYLVAPILATSVFENSSLTELIRIAAVGIPFIVLSSVSISLARGSRDARPHAFVNQLFQPFARLILIAGLLILRLNAAGAVIGQTLALTMAALIALYLAYRAVPDLSGPSEPMYRSVLLFSLPLVAVQGMGFLNSNIDVYMVGYFMQSPDLGVYNIALQLGNLLTAVVATFGFLLPPVLTRLHKNNKPEQMRRTFQVLTKWIVIIGLPAFIVLFFAPKFVIGTLFGENYARGALALQVLAAGKLFAMLMGLNGQALIALGDNKVVSYIVFCQTFVNVAANVLLIPIFGFVGAAAGIAASIVVGDVLGAAVLYRRYEVHPLTRTVLSTIFAVLATAVFSFFLLQAMRYPTEAVVVVIGILYLPIVAWLAPEPEDEELLQLVEEQTGYDFEFLRGLVRSVE
jgi:O-antigen/teichoic acid export membrane protein